MARSVFGRKSDAERRSLAPASRPGRIAHLDRDRPLVEAARRDPLQFDALYRTLCAPPVVATPAPAPERVAIDEQVMHERIRRDNIILQLRRQFDLAVDETASTEALERQLHDHIAGEQAGRRGSASRPSVEAAIPVAVPPTALIATAAPTHLLSAKPLDTTALIKPLGVVSGLVVDNNGDRLVGISFNASLNEHLTAIISHAAGTMAQAKQAKTCLVLLGHGDGVNIGMGEHPVNLTDHLKANREAYHTLLGTKQIDCVAILSCSRESYSQFTAFRDGLGYYPTWRVSAWEHTYQNAFSGLAALQLTLAQDRGSSFRAAVFTDAAQQIASLAEVGERTATIYFAATPAASGMVLTPTRRK